MKILAKILLVLLPLHGSLLSYAQNWLAFGTVGDTLIYEVYDPTLTQTNLLPLVEGITASANDFEMSPLYGLHAVSHLFTADSVHIWKLNPVYNGVYLQDLQTFGDYPPGRFPLQELIQKNDSVTLKTATDTLFFSLKAQPGMQVWAGDFGQNHLFLVLDSIYGVLDNGIPDTLATYTGYVFDDLMNPLPSDPLYGQHLLLFSKNKGLIFFPDMSLVEQRLLTFSRIAYEEPLVEDIFAFEVGDLFLFYNGDDSHDGHYYHTLNEIISKTETDSTWLYVEKITRDDGTVTYGDFSVKKDLPLRSLLGTSDVGSPLHIDSITDGEFSGVGHDSWTYIEGPLQIQGRRILLLPDYQPLYQYEDICEVTRMYVEGVGLLFRECLMMPSGWQPPAPNYVARYHQKLLLAYEKVNGDNYGSIPANFLIDEWEQNAGMAYPNPVSDILYLKNNGVRYELLDIYGQTVEKRGPYYEESQIGLSMGHLSAGTYVLRVTLSDGDMLIQKIIKR